MIHISKIEIHAVRSRKKKSKKIARCCFVCILNYQFLELENDPRDAGNSIIIIRGVTNFHPVTD